MEAFGEEINAPGAKLAQAKANKLETRLIAAMTRQDVAYNRYAATVESVNKTTAVVSRSTAGKGKEAAKTEDGKLLKRKLKELDEGVDRAGKTHQKHLHAFISCKSLSDILWRLLDAFRLSMANSGDMEAIEKDVRMWELYTHKALTDRIDEMLVRELLEYALNFGHEQTVVVYLSHHYNHVVVQAFSGDKLYLVDQTTPTQERIDAAVNRVQKSTPLANAAIAPGGGKHKRGGHDGGGKNKWKGKQQQQ